MGEQRGGVLRGPSPIKQSAKAKSTSWRVAVEWREASTKDAGWREEDMDDRRSGGQLRNGSFDSERHGLIFGRQRAGKSDRLELCQAGVSCGLQKVSGMLR